MIVRTTSTPEAQPSGPAATPCAVVERAARDGVVLAARFHTFIEKYAVPFRGPNIVMNAKDALWCVRKMGSLGAVGQPTLAWITADIVLEAACAFFGAPDDHVSDEDGRLLAGASVAVNLRLGDVAQALAAGMGVAPNAAARGTFETLVAKPAFVQRAVATPSPRKYLHGSVSSVLRTERTVRQAPNRVTLDHYDGSKEPEDVAAEVGIDVERFLADLRTSGRPRFFELADTIERWLDGNSKAAIGGSAYERMRYNFRTPVVRALAMRAGITTVPQVRRPTGTRTWYWFSPAKLTACHRYTGAELAEYGRAAVSCLPFRRECA